VLWFEWDLYDQLQLLQLLDFFAGKLGTREDPLKIEIVSFAGYLGTLPIEQFQELNNQRQPVTVPTMMLGRSGWRAVTSSDPREIEKMRKSDTSSLPFLSDALTRFLEELPWTSDGLARSERQLLEGLDDGATTIPELFDYATNREDRIYCGDASAALYLHRLAGGSSPLVSIQANDSESPSMMTATLGITDKGRKVLQGEGDWIALGGSDRWIGGVHLEGPSAKWRWNSGTKAVTTSLAG
jgi:hypothetical protein